jgi:predicted alpha/beta hydrolase
MQSFGGELVAVADRHARTTAVAISGLLDGFSEGQLPRVNLSLAQKLAAVSFGSAAPVRAC